MAITLARAMTAEMLSPNERYPYTSSVGSQPLISTAQARSGSASWRTYGSANKSGIPNPANEVGMSAWIMTDQPNGKSWIFAGMKQNPASPTLARPCVAIGWDMWLKKIEIQVDDTGPYTGIPNLTSRAKRSSLVQNGVLHRLNTWVHVALYANKAFPAMSFYINGEQVLKWTGSGGPWLEAVEVWACCNGHYSGTAGWRDNAYFDDFYVYDATGEGDHIPEARRFIMTLPSGVGASSQWTPLAGNNFENVDDPSTPDADTTYVETDTIGKKDLYAHAGLTSADFPYQYIIQDDVLMQIEYRMVDDSQIADIDYEMVANDGALESAVGTYGNIDYGTWYLEQGTFSGQPDGTPWNLVDFNAMEFGMKSK